MNHSLRARGHRDESIVEVERARRSRRIRVRPRLSTPDIRARLALPRTSASRLRFVRAEPGRPLGARVASRWRGLAPVAMHFHDSVSNLDEERGTASVDRTAIEFPRPLTAPPLAVGYPPGTVVGRYVVVRPLGRGGMGAVMLAFDRQLGRRVALKVMLTNVSSEEARIRFVREAQTMARLAHPNVVGIYDVGVHGGNVFLAMEYVDGALLSDWLQEKHSIREVLAVMKQAGEGLHAAHAANVVHRDFKPTNVIIARDGRVCVFDFGIARTEGVEEPTVAREAAASGRRPAALVRPSSDSPDPLTAAGAMVGTVGYASPEQTLGEATDARSDVFSFTVTLWLALYGEKPFDSSLVVNYILAVNGKEHPTRPAGSKVPSWLHLVLERGLARDRSARFASMKELLAALDADPTPRRWGLVSALAIVVAAALVVAGIARHEVALRATCRAEGRAVPDAWKAKRAAVERSLRTETDSLAGERTDRTLSALDAYAASLQHAQIESCEATRVTKTQNEETYERRGRCLLDLQTQLDVVADVLGGDDAKIHHQSLAMASGLDAPSQCTDAATPRTLLPNEPAVRAALLAAQRDLDRARYPDAMGLAEARALAERARDVARDAHDGRTEALGEFAVGDLSIQMHDHDKALRTMWRAYELAESVGADSVSTHAALRLAFLFDEMHRADDAREWIDVARAKISRMGSPPPLEIDLLGYARLLDPANPRRALELDARAMTLIESTYGATSMKLCHAHQLRGALFHELEEPDDAAAEYEMAIRCQIRATASATDEELVVDYANLSRAQLAQGHGDDAIASARRAADAMTVRDTDAGLLAVPLALESKACTAVGNVVEAVRLAERAVAIAERNGGGGMSLATFALGVARMASGDAVGARVACARAVAIDDEDNPPSADKTYDDDALECLGEAELVLGDGHHARGHLERSAALLRRAGPGALARARFALARALLSRTRRSGGVEGEGDTVRALALATRARDELRGVVEHYPFLKPSLEEVDGWLAARRR